MGKKQSRFTVLDSRNQGTKQLPHFYNWVWTAHALPLRVDPESSERLNQLGFYRAVIFILTPPFKAALYYTTLLENGQHWRSDLSTPTFSLSPIDTLSFHPLSNLCRHPQCRQEIQLGTILLMLPLFSLHFPSNYNALSHLCQAVPFIFCVRANFSCSRRYPNFQRYCIIL